jgi:uncharacterized repeat protein (TIGR01451 family)
MLFALAVPMAMLVATGCREATSEPARFDQAPEGYVERVAYYPSGEVLQSVLMVRKMAPKRVRVGETFEYYIELHNPTDKVVLKNLLIRDYIDPNVRIIGSSPEWYDIDAAEEEGEYVPDAEERKQWREGRDLDDFPRPKPAIGKVKPVAPWNAKIGEKPEIRWFVGSLFPEKSIDIRVRAKAVAGELDETRIINCASVDYQIAACVASRVVEPELKLNMQLQRDFIICSTDQVDLKLRLKNTGSGTINNAVARVHLPEGLEAADGTNTITWNAGSLSGGDSKQHTPKVTVLRPGQYSVKAKAEGDGEIETEAASVQLTARQGSIDVTVDGPETEYVGLAAEYEVNVTNNGDARVRELEVRAPVPTNTEFVEATHDGSLQNNQIVWTFPRLEAGESQTLAYRVRGTDEGSYRAIAKAEAICTGEVTDMVQTKLEGVAAMVVEVVDNRDPNKVGQEEVYEIRVTNQGSAPETNVIVHCELGEGQRLISTTGETDTGAKRGARKVTFNPVESLTAGQTAEWSVKVDCNTEGDIRFYVEVNSDQHTRPVRETEATRIYK